MPLKYWPFLKIFSSVSYDQFKINTLNIFLSFPYIGGGAFLTLSYGLSFGNDRTYQWFTSMIVSFISSLIITQPIKVDFIYFFKGIVMKYF